MFISLPVAIPFLREELSLSSHVEASWAPREELSSENSAPSGGLLPVRPSSESVRIEQGWLVVPEQSSRANKIRLQATG